MVITNPLLGGFGYHGLQALRHRLLIVAQPDTTDALGRGGEDMPLEDFVGDADLAAGCVIRGRVRQRQPRPKVTHYPTGLTDIAELMGQPECADLGTGYLLLLSLGGLLGVRDAHRRYRLRPPR
ncbi:hypothetical protein OKW32_000274 [Paraburkholderia youngii]